MRGKGLFSLLSNCMSMRENLSYALYALICTPKNQIMQSAILLAGFGLRSLFAVPMFLKKAYKKAPCQLHAVGASLSITQSP